MEKKRGITIRLGPLGLSLLAAGITAVGVAAVSFADSGSGSGKSDNSNDGPQTFQMQAPPPGGGPGIAIAGANLSSEDQKKLDEFRQCMQDNGAPGPPDPAKIDPSDGPPKPPSAADREKAEKAFEACKSKLPDKLQNAPFGGMHGVQCGPPPGVPPAQGQSQQGTNKDQSGSAATQSSGSDT
jgi:hypothetical protein